MKNQTCSFRTDSSASHPIILISLDIIQQQLTLVKNGVGSSFVSVKYPNINSHFVAPFSTACGCQSTDAGEALILRLFNVQ